MKYTFEVGVEGPGIDPADDCIEIEVVQSEIERMEILEAYDIYMWDDDVLKDLFDDYLDDLKQRLVSIAMPLITEKWGDKAKEENGARYFIVIPDKISEEYFDTEAYLSFCSAQEAMQANCRRQAHYEFQVLSDGVTSGRWPHFERTKYWELFQCATFIGERKATYSMEGQCSGVKVEYSKRYDLHHSEMEIRLYGNLKYTDELIEKHLKTCGRKIRIKDMSFHYVVYIPSKEDETDIQILLPLLDQLEKDSVSYK